MNLMAGMSYPALLGLIIAAARERVGASSRQPLMMQIT
jgi:hypothetical protein